MSPVDARARRCSECDQVVHDLSSMTEAETRALLRAGPACVRYLYDGRGQIIPASSLTSRLLRAAAMAVSAMVFEACGGHDGGFGAPVEDAAPPDGGEPDAYVHEPPHTVPDAGVPDDAVEAPPDAEEPPP